ncbi:MAG: hypothetical protein JWR23_1541 [Mucilaginibacter sp.]|nr:hypothetical protein [Mucilaginibacter sp.]
MDKKKYDAFKDEVAKKTISGLNLTFQIIHL